MTPVMILIPSLLIAAGLCWVGCRYDRRMMKGEAEADARRDDEQKSAFTITVRYAK